MELAAIPLAIFLDEPTSGLDATSALDVTNVLKSISRLGITVISIIHQPRVEIFDEFDDLLMIAPGGRTAYLGPVSESQSYFESLGFFFPPSANRADILMDIIAGRGVHESDYKGKVNSVDDIVSLWNPQSAQTISEQEEKPKDPQDVIQNMTQISNLRGANVMKQLWFCHNRSLIQQSRFLSSLWLELGVGILAGGIMGAAALGDEIYKGIFISPFTPLSSSPSAWFVAMYGMLIGSTCFQKHLFIVFSIYLHIFFYL
jgi:energy-coupling factor transporter ATP-binding protein EcfA2